jgi:hypothetical protein
MWDVGYESGETGIRCRGSEVRGQKTEVRGKGFFCGSGFQPRSYNLNDFNEFNDFYDFPFTAHCLPLTTFPLPS